MLDLGLPDGDGVELVRAGARAAARCRSSSSRRATTRRRRSALLDAGADDYLTKPFGVAELLARMRVALRHRGTRARAGGDRARSSATCASTSPRAQVERDGAPLHLTPTEYELLARLARSAGKVVTHRQLLADVWGAEYTEHTHYLRLYMGQLRAKIEARPGRAAPPADRDRRRLPARRRLTRQARCHSAKATCRPAILMPVLMRRRLQRPPRNHARMHDIRLRPAPAAAALTLGALGVVYGDIGTSPLYTIKEMFGPAHRRAAGCAAPRRRGLGDLLGPDAGGHAEVRDR